MNIFDLDLLDEISLLRLAEALQLVLNARTHKHTHLGEEIIVKGSLSKALKLPEIIKHLDASESKRIKARAKLDDVWWSLSDNTRQRALEAAEIYQPNDLDWDDPRSNRYHNFVDKKQ